MPLDQVHDNWSQNQCLGDVAADHRSLQREYVQWWSEKCCCTSIPLTEATQTTSWGTNELHTLSMTPDTD
jgi:hypothetical protein